MKLRWQLELVVAVDDEDDLKSFVGGYIAVGFAVVADDSVGALPPDRQLGAGCRALKLLPPVMQLWRPLQQTLKRADDGVDGDSID